MRRRTVLLGLAVLGVLRGQGQVEAEAERRRELAWRAWQAEVERQKGRLPETPDDWLKREVAEFIDEFNRFGAKLQKGEVDWGGLKKARRKFDRFMPIAEACKKR
jgi:hypothetical protein